MNEFNDITSSDSWKGPQREYTHEETIDKINKYSLRADLEEFRFLQELRMEYQTLTDIDIRNRNASVPNYALGIRAGLPHASYDQLRADQEKFDQARRRKYLERVREFYSEKVGIAKGFNQNAKEGFTETQNLKAEQDKPKDEKASINHHQAHVDKLDNYIQIAGPEKSAFLQQLKDAYLKNVQIWREKQKDLDINDPNAIKGEIPFVFEKNQDKEPVGIQTLRETGAIYAKDDYDRNHGLSQKFNKASKGHEHQQLLRQIDLYMQVADAENSGYLQQLKDSYERTYTGWQVRQKFQDKKQEIARRSGVPLLLKDDLEAAREAQERELRHTVAMKAKDNYHHNYSLTSKFNEEAHVPPIGKTKEGEKEMEK